ncbi:MAG: zinc-binding dehydrogenase [Chloroflexi bacterium]|nr:zinc-binding dehydrogenase [Chloroflexota bacterium]
MSIKAVVVDPEVSGRLRIGDVPDPSPAPNEAVVRVAAISLNRGEVRGAQAAAAGARPGWDIAGVVEKAAADGSGPKQGQRVVGLLRTGAWAEAVAVPTNALAALPDAVTFAQAATLPVAGLTALLALEKGNGLLERNVLITGASGGVGLFAVQLAAIGGARVTGVVRQERHAESVRKLGAHSVVVDETAAAAASGGPYDLILESVAGRSLGNALGMLAINGTCVLFGVSEGATVTFDAARFFRSSRSSLYAFGVFSEFALEPASRGLARLAQLVAGGKLLAPAEIEAPWTEIGAVSRQLLDRSFPGKAVLHVS